MDLASGRGDRQRDARPTATRGSRAAAFRAVGAQPGLRRVEIGWAGVVSGESIAQIAIGVLTFHVAGIGGLGLLVALQMLPSALLAPKLATLGDRFRRERLMLGCDAARLVIVAAGAVAADAHSSEALGYAVAIGLALAQCTFNPAQRALVPLLVAAPSELTAASVVTGLVQGICQVAGPLLGGVVLALAGTPAALLVAAGCFAIAVAADLGLPSSVSLAQRPTQSELQSVRAGARVALGDARLRLVLALFAAKNLGRGALNVLIVLIPLTLLGMGSAGVGWLTAAIGVGGVIGGAAAATLVTRRRLSTAMAAGIALWGLAFVAIGAIPELTTALVALVALGIGNAICDASGYSLVPRSTRDDLLIRVYGIHESVRAIAIAAGGALTAVVALHAGTREALFCVATILLASAGAGMLLRRHDTAQAVDPQTLALLRGVPLLGWLPSVALERLASKLSPLELDAGAVLLREGETGDRAYLIEQGELLVSLNGREVGRLGRGDLVGEIALLHSVPRTATVAALSPVRVLALDRSEFLVAATGTPRACHGRRFRQRAPLTAPHLSLPDSCGRLAAAFGEC